MLFVTAGQSRQRAVVCLLHLRREKATWRLVALEMITYALAAQALPRAGLVGAGTFFLVGLLVAIHETYLQTFLSRHFYNMAKTPSSGSNQNKFWHKKVSLGNNKLKEAVKMQTFPGEKSIVAHFRDSDTAYQAAKSLRYAGLGTADVNQISSDSANKDPYYENPVDATLSDIMPTAYSSGVVETVNGSDSLHSSANNSPDVQGFGNSDYEAVLTLSTTKGQAGKAVEIIRNYGGYV